MSMSFIEKYTPKAVDCPMELKFILQFILGLSGVTFLGQVVNIYSGIALFFFVVILAISLLYTCFNLRPAIKYAKKILRAIKPQSLIFLLFGCVILIIALSKATLVTDNMDEMGYYLTTVKWIEQGPTVPGVALLNGRLGINSAWHMSSAIFGFDFLYKGGAYDLNALLFCFMFILGIRAGYRLYKSKSNSYTSDVLLLSSLVFPFQSLIDSMDADYPSMFIGLFLLAEIIRRIECHEFYKLDSRYYAYVIISLFLFTVKPFSILYLLYPLIVSIYHFINKKKTPIFVLTLLSMAYTMPWLYRNYLISGYVLYPLHFVDLFDPVWKLPYDYVRNTSIVVAEYAKVELIRADYLYSGVNPLSVTEWLPTWLSNNWNLMIGKFVIIFLPLSAVSLLLEIILLKAKSKLWYFKLVLSMICVLWFFNFPSIRFGWAFILAFVVITAVGYIQFFKLSKQSLLYIIAFLVALSLARNIVKTAIDINSEAHVIYPKRTPQLSDYDTIETNFIYYKSKTEYCYDKLPCMPGHNPWRIYQRTSDIHEGFILQEDKN